METPASEIGPVNVQIEASWKEQLKEEFDSPYFANIKQQLVLAKRAGKVIYPPGKLIFNAFDQTPFDQVRVIIIGQDPYHGPRQAMGLCFSVDRSVTIPASLRNIYKELHRDLGLPIPEHGDLSKWARQGVFLLNAVLTVQRGNAGSHRKIGWERFTNAVIQKLSTQRDGLIFLLWGNFAKSKKPLIDEMKHHVMEAVHPSPLAGNAFIGCSHFSRTNAILEERGEQQIDWSVDG